MAERAPKLREDLRALPGSAWVLFAGVFVNRLGTFVLPFFVLYLTRSGFSASQAGAAIGAYALGGLAAQAVAGLLADRFGRRNTIALSMFGAGALTLVLWRAQTLALIYPLMFGVACLGEIHRPAGEALIADLVPSERRLIAFAMFRLALNVGWAAGLALGGVLAERSFDLLFVGDAITSLAFGLISLLALPHGTRSARRDEENLPSARAAILADRGFLLLLASALVGGVVYIQYVTSLPLQVRDAGYGPAAYGALQSINGVMVVLIELPVIAWARRHERFRVVAIGQLLIGFGFAALLLADTIPLLAGIVVVWTLGEICAVSPAAAIAADRSPEYARGRYQSALHAGWGTGFVLGSLFGTIAYSAAPAALWWACGVLGVVAAGLSVAARRLPDPVVDVLPRGRPTEGS